MMVTCGPDTSSELEVAVVANSLDYTCRLRLKAMLQLLPVVCSADAYLYRHRRSSDLTSFAN